MAPENLARTRKELKVQQICRSHGIELATGQMDLLRSYVSLLLEWNRKVNLISRLDVDNIWFSHILHSLSPLFLLEIPTGCKVLDLGSGGGLPGIPLSIARPDLQFSHVDSVMKKAAALAIIVGKLGLENHVVTSRAEALSDQKGQTGEYDIVTARAVAPLVDLVKWSRPLLRKNLHSLQASPDTSRNRYVLTSPALIAMKGGDLGEEIRSARIKTEKTDITELSLVFDGSEKVGLEEKKIVIVQFTNT